MTYERSSLRDRIVLLGSSLALGTTLMLPTTGRAESGVFDGGIRPDEPDTGVPAADAGTIDTMDASGDDGGGVATTDGGTSRIDAGGAPPASGGSCHVAMGRDRSDPWILGPALMGAALTWSRRRKR